MWSRRRVLSLAAAWSVSASGCALLGARPAADATRATLVVAGPPWPDWTLALRHAWRTGGHAFDLTFAVPGSCDPAALDLFPVREVGVRDTNALSGSGLSVTAAGVRGTAYRNLSDALGPEIKLGNLRTAELVPDALQAFSDARGRLAAFPLALGELQFYTHGHAVAAAGGSPSAPWSWGAVERTVAAARAATPTGAAPLIVGWGWADVRLWTAAVSGFGGHIVWKQGAVDLSGAQAATVRLVALARAARWNPAPTFRPGTPEYTFVRRGFTGAAGAALFAFASPPVLAGVARDGFDAAIAGQTHLSAPGIGDAKAADFPAFPGANPWPAVDPVGLATTQSSRHVPEAVAFMAWYYAPAQQALLARLGYPPMVTTPSVQAAWTRAQPGAATRFDGNRYFDVVPTLPASTFGAWSAEPLTMAVQRLGPHAYPDFVVACRRMYGGADVAATLKDLQTGLNTVAGWPRAGGVPTGACP